MPIPQVNCRHYVWMLSDDPNGVFVKLSITMGIFELTSAFGQLYALGLKHGLWRFPGRSVSVSIRNHLLPHLVYALMPSLSVAIARDHSKGDFGLYNSGVF